MSWVFDLVRASFDGVEFSVVSASDNFSRRHVRHEYPYRDGAEIEDLGRVPRETTLEAILHGPTYLEDLDDLLTAADEGTIKVFVHPLLGIWDARIVAIDVSHSQDRRDAAFVAMRIVEDGTDTELPILISIEAAKQELAANNSTLLSDLAALKDDVVGTYEATDNAVSDLQEFADDVESTVDDLTQRIDQTRKYVERSIDELEEVADVSNWPVVRSVRVSLWSAHRLKDSVERSTPQLKRVALPITAPTEAISQGLYGRSGRARDIERLNRIRNPHLTKSGQDLRVPSE